MSTPDPLQIIAADALSGLAQVPDASVQVALTSPPFYLLRRYGTPTTWPDGMPEPTLDRPSRNYEFLFLFSKRPDYRFDRRAIDIPARSSARRGDRANCGSVWQTPTVLHSEIIADSDQGPDGLWQINPEASPYRHVAMWPRSLVRQMLGPTAHPGDTVLDPFAGSGTTGEVALELGLRAILIEPAAMAQTALADRLDGTNLALAL